MRSISRALAESFLLFELTWSPAQWSLHRQLLAQSTLSRRVFIFSSDLHTMLSFLDHLPRCLRGLLRRSSDPRLTRTRRRCRAPFNPQNPQTHRLGRLSDTRRPRLHLSPPPHSSWSSPKKTRQELGGRPQHPLTTNQIQQRQQRPHERHDLTRHSGRQLEMERYGMCLLKQQTQNTNTTHHPYHHDYDNPANNARPNNKND